MSLPFEKFLIDTSRLEFPNSISSQQARADIDFLIEALVRAYPGKWAMKQVEWEEVIQKLKTIHIDSSVQVNDLGESIADILWSIPDGHLKVRFGGLVCGQFFKSNLRKPSTGDNLVDLDKGEYWKLQTKETSIGAVSILAISGFPQSSEPCWDGFLEATDEILRSRHLIVDLRGNAGGDDTKAIELVTALLGYEMDESWVKQLFCETAEAYALQINTYEQIIWNNYRSKNETPPVELVDHLGKLKAKAIELTSNPVPGDKSVIEIPLLGNPMDRNVKFDGNIYLLVDPHTVSSGEWTCLYFKKHPNTKIVGENTYGMIHFGNTGYLQLPYSGLSVAVCMKINELTDGSFYEKKGIPPDIRISGKDSLEFVFSELIK